MKTALLLSLVINISLANAMEITKGENYHSLNNVSSSNEKSTENSTSATNETNSSSSEKTEPFKKTISSREVYREVNCHR